MKFITCLIFIFSFLQIQSQTVVGKWTALDNTIVFNFMEDGNLQIEFPELFLIHQ